MNKRTVISLVAILILAGGAVYALWQERPDAMTQDAAKPDYTEAPAGIVDDQPGDGSGLPVKGSTPSEPSNETPENNQPAQPAVTAVITNAYQDPGTGNLVVQTKLEDITSGTCRLTVTNSSQTLQRQADVLYAPSFSTCKGFEISSDAFTQSGTWTVSLAVETGTNTIKAEPVDVTIQK